MMDCRVKPSNDEVGYLRHPPYSTPASSGVNSYTDEQNSQVTTTLPSFTMSERSPGAKLFSTEDTASREQEHCARSGSGAKTRTPRSWNSRYSNRSPDKSGSISSTSSTVAINDWPSTQASSSVTAWAMTPSGASP